MTLHVAATYLDHNKGMAGILLGADRFGTNIPGSAYIEFTEDRSSEIKPEWILSEEKSFGGKGQIGVYSGRFLCRAGEHQREFRTLDNCFDDTTKTGTYNKHPFLKKAHYYHLSVVTYKKTQVRLDTVHSHRKRGKNKADTIFRYALGTESYNHLERMPYWNGLNTYKRNPAFGFIPGRQSCDAMVQHLLCIMEAVAKERPKEVAAPFDIYAIDFDGIRKVA
ncbi:MAG: hypothetical protein AABX82_04150 [Nanoarchaeota archaeon]